MYYSDYRSHDTADGEGIRVSLYVSGCSLACKGCFNQEAWSLTYGDKFTEEVLDELIKDCKKPYIRGLSLLGGDPMEKENQEEVLNIIKRFREEFGNEKDIWVWTGRRIEDLLNNEFKDNTEYTKEILCAGSENQRRIDLRNIHTIEELSSINDWNELDCEVK